MKKFYFFLALLLGVLTVRCQTTVIMKINAITPAAGDKLIAFEGDIAMPVAANGTSTGKPAFDDIKIKKPLSISSQLIKQLLQGTHMAVVEFDFMDNSNTMIYQIILSEAIVTKFTYLSPECPSCQSLTNEIWFNFRSITYTDPVNSKTVSFNINANTIE